MAEPEKCADNYELHESNLELKAQTVLLGDENLSGQVVTPAHHNTASNSNTSTILELENKLIQRNDEINNLTKLAAKYKRQLEKANKYNEDLRNELSLLSSELHTYRCRSFDNKSVDTQVTDTEIEEAYGNKPMPEWRTDSGKGLEGLSIADSLKAAAEAELQNQLKTATDCYQLEFEQQRTEDDLEYVFDASTGLYYHPSTGYYWDPNYELFYDNTTGTYYQYNEKNGEYEIHSQVDMTEQSEIFPGIEGNSEKLSSEFLKNGFPEVLNYEEKNIMLTFYKNP